MEGTVAIRAVWFTCTAERSSLILMLDYIANAACLAGAHVFEVS